MQNLHGEEDRILKYWKFQIQIYREDDLGEKNAV